MEPKRGQNSFMRLHSDLVIEDGLNLRTPSPDAIQEKSAKKSLQLRKLGVYCSDKIVVWKPQGTTFLLQKSLQKKEGQTSELPPVTYFWSFLFW